nr:hypothetical protein [Candidatus Njordarchaeum guaymaensis]
MIEVDDAGWGDLLDGVVLGFLRVEDGVFLTKVINVKFFQPPLFAKKQYLDEAVKLAREALKELGTKKGEEIQICTAPVLEKVRETMTKDGYKVVPTKIVGELQLRVETAFIERLEELGVVKNTVPLDPCKDRFYAQLRWIHGDLAHRERYVKTAWKSWKRWRAWQMRPRRTARARFEDEIEPFNLIE